VEEWGVKNSAQVICYWLKYVDFKYICFAFTLVLSILLSLETPLVVVADTTMCSGASYSTCTGQGYSDHGYGANNMVSYWRMDTGHNCTNYAAYAEQTVNKAPAPDYLLGNAYQWGSNAQAHGIAVNSNPGNGSIAWWNQYTSRGSLGHVAYVEAVNADGSIIISEDAANSGPFAWEKITPGSSRWPTGFIHFKDLPSGSFAGSSNTFMLINSAGAAYANDQLSTGMSRQTVDGDAVKVAVGGNFMALINSCGALWGKTALSSASWTQMTNCGDTHDVAVGSSGIYVIINGCGAAWSRGTASGLGMDGWTQLTSCGDTKAIAAGGQNIALINGSGTAYASTTWWGQLQRVSNIGDAKAITISSGGFLMMINGCGAAWANNAIGTNGWIQKTGCSDAVRISAGGSRLALINSGGTAYATDQWNGGLTQISNPGDAREIAVGDKGFLMMINGCGAAWAKNTIINTSNWAPVTGCGDAVRIAD
jgi:surface antigen